MPTHPRPPDVPSATWRMMSKKQKALAIMEYMGKMGLDTWPPSAEPSVPGYGPVSSPSGADHAALVAAYINDQLEKAGVDPQLLGSDMPRLHIPDEAYNVCGTLPFRQVDCSAAGIPEPGTQEHKLLPGAGIPSLP